jgi:hypothetical protein
MSRISQNNLVQAIIAVKAMDLKQKGLLADDIFRAQPNLLGTVLVLRQLGVSLPKIDFALDMLFVCFEAMRKSGLAWPLITEADLDRQLRRYTAIVRFSDGLNVSLREGSVQQYLEDYPEKELLAYVQGETAKWLTSIVPEDADKHVMLAVSNMVNCIAFVDL